MESDNNINSAMGGNQSTPGVIDELVSGQCPSDSISKNQLYSLIKLEPSRVTYKCNPSPHATSEAWKRFKIVCVDGKDVDYVKCNSCITIFQWTSRVGTTTMSRHKCAVPTTLKSECPPEQLKLTSLVPKKVPHATVQNINDKIVTGLALDMRPLSTVKGRGFKNIAQELINFGAKYGPHKVEDVIRTPHNLKSHLKDISGRMKTELRKMLHSSPTYPNFAYTFDLWTEQKRNRPFISLTCHFVDARGTLSSKLLAVDEMEAEQEKTIINVRAACRRILEQYFEELEVTTILKESYAVTDGGSNVITVFANRLPCMCHKLNLIMTHSFSNTTLKSHQEVAILLQQAKALVKYFKKAGLNSSLPKSLKQCVPTRWNSNLIMLESITASIHDIQRILLEKSELSRIKLFDDKLANELIILLKPFEDATSLFSAENQVTIDKIVPRFYSLQKHLQPNEKDGPVITNMRSEMMKWFVKYYTASLETLHYVATSLNPSFKSLKNVPEDRRQLAVTRLRQLCCDCKVASRDSPVIESVENAPVPDKKRKLDHDYLSDFKDSSDEEEITDKDEVDAYLDLKLSKPEKEAALTNPLSFWTKERNRFPTLSKVAFTILAIPASEASDERTFSVTGNIICDRRSMLSGDTVSDLTFVHKNYT